MQIGMVVTTQINNIARIATRDGRQNRDKRQLEEWQEGWIDQIE